MNGVLRALSIETYGIFSKGKMVHEFQVTNVKLRKKLDISQGKNVDFEKDIKPLLTK